VIAEAEILVRSGPTDRQLADVRAAILRDFETNRRQNAFIVGQLAQRYQAGEPPDSLWELPALVEALTPREVHDAARDLLDLRQYVRVTLKPE
jgi:predicted Zn-dependent peptidase